MSDTRLVGNYRILETLGKGGYSWVKKGVDDAKKNVVALKFMARANDAWAKDQAAQVSTEIRSLTHVQHENVMKLYAYNLNAKYPEKSGKTINTILLVLEYCPGGELFDILYYTDKLDAKTARTYFRMMIQGLSACHDAGITHRDIKPQNLLLDKHYNLKLTDFGLSNINSDPNSTMSTSYVGTRGYQAPELLAGKKYLKSCDVFSCGVVLFILLTGYPPFEQGTKKDKWYRPLARGNYTKFWENHKGCGITDPECMKLIESMLAYKPQKRISLAEIMAHAWYKGEVWNKKELKSKLRKRHSECMSKRKSDANKQREMQQSVKQQPRDLPQEQYDFMPDLGEPGLFNVLSVPCKPFHAIWRAKEILEEKKCKVDWNKEKPFQFIANFEDTEGGSYALRVHVRRDSEGNNYMELKRVSNKGPNSAVKFRKMLNQFIIFIQADDTFRLGFEKDGKTRVADEKKEAPVEVEKMAPVEEEKMAPVEDVAA